MKSNSFTISQLQSKPVALKSGLPPILSKTTTTLILGSFPGEASLKAEQYYAHPRNYFWQLLSDVFNEPFSTLSYPNKILRLNQLDIGLWDAVDACVRIGSLDTAIKQAKINNLDKLRHLAPELKRIFFNGKAAGKFASLITEGKYKTIILPSSSPANASLTYAEKLSAWRCLL